MPTNPPPGLTFPRSSRIKTGRDFSRIKERGQRVAIGCLAANWLKPGEMQTPRLGVITSRKIGNAVERSRARRLLREAFRLHQHQFEKPVDLILIARASIARKKFAAVEADFLRAMHKGALLVRE